MKRLLIFITLFLCVLPLTGKAAEEEKANFSAIIVTGTNGKYEVKGKVNPKLNAFFYTVEDGHEEYISETKINVSRKKNFTIQIKIPREKLPENATLIMNLYSKTSDGKKTSSYPIVLDTFE